MTLNPRYKLKGFLKTNEAIYGTKCRSRLIFNPPDESKVLMGAMNYNILRATKRILPEFVSGLNIQ